MPSKSVVVNSSQLKSAFRKHKKLGETGSDISHYLLMFYAGECGLKSLYLDQERLRDTNDFEVALGKKYGHSHDLQKWIDEIKIPKFSIKYKGRDDDPVSQIHERLRYGVDSKRNHKDFLKTLNSLLNNYL